MTVLSATQIKKNFGPIQALRGVDLQVDSGEIHALLGENGAGKTTLMNILFGLLSADGGTIRLSGKPYRPQSPRDAMMAGLGMVHQHFMLVPTLTVLENILLGESPLSLYRKERTKAEVQKQMDEISFDLPLERRIDSLSVGERQRVEIFKALRKGARILILDEPTAVLAPQEIEGLFILLCRLKVKGHSILFISHKLDEIREHCDRVTLLRKGQTIGTFQVAGMDKKALTHLLLGRDLRFTEKTREPGHEIRAPFVVEPVTPGRGILRGRWTCEIAPGQITAVAGIEGNGQRELAEAVLGISHTDRVRIRIGTETLTEKPVERIRSGIGLISEDRQRTGLVAEFSIEENLVLKDVHHFPFSNKGWLNKGAIRARATDLVQRFGIEPLEPSRPVSELSGGNQQKVVVAREISRDHRLLVAFNPTRGLDIGACETVYNALLEDAKAGAGILLISTELDEVLRLADRLYVLFQGNLVEIPKDEWSSEKIGFSMLGVARGGES